MAGWERAAPSLSWMIWRWRQTPLFPAQRTSSAKLSKSPRTSKSCCEQLRTTNTTGQNVKRDGSDCLLHLLAPITSFQSSFLDHDKLCLCPVISPLFFFTTFTPLLLLLLPFCSAHVVLVSLSFTPVSRPCEREGVRRLRHSLGCFSTLVPWAEKPPSPLQPLSLRAPDPTSWYSGFCPCLPGTVLFSSP